jgi:hypothetical protein
MAALGGDLQEIVLHSITGIAGVALNTFGVYGDPALRQ